MTETQSRIDGLSADDRSSATLDRLLARAQTADVVHTWCRAVDRLDLSLMREVFHPDAVDEHGAYVGDVDGLIAWVERRHRGVIMSSHAVSNVLIEFVTSDIAVCESYVQVVQRYPADGRESLTQLSGPIGDRDATAFDLHSRSRYLDRMERRAGRWAIARRRLIEDWKRVDAVHGSTGVPRDNAILGVHGISDPSYAFRDEACGATTVITTHHTSEEQSS